MRNSNVQTKNKSAKEQSRRFIETAREAGASEDEADFDRALKRIAKTKPKPAPEDSEP